MNTNHTPLVDDPFTPTGTPDTMTENSGQTIRQRTDLEEQDFGHAMDTDNYAGHATQAGGDINEMRILQDFEWKTAASGKRYLQAKQAYIDRFIHYGQPVLDAFIFKLRDGDVPKDYTRNWSGAMALGTIAQEYISTVKADDERVANRRLVEMFNGAGRTACIAYSILLRAESWQQQLNGKDTPAKLNALITQGETFGLDAAYWFTEAFLAADSRNLINWKSVAYEYARYQANSNQKYLGDPNRGKTNEENTSNATTALLSRLLPREAKAA